MSGSFIAPHQFRQLESVEPGHLDIDKRQRHIVLEQKLERLVAGIGFEQLQAIAAQEAFQSDKIFLKIVNEEKRNGFHVDLNLS
jgi:hypothetical protein